MIVKLTAESIIVLGVSTAWLARRTNSPSLYTIHCQLFTRNELQCPSAALLPRPQAYQHKASNSWRCEHLTAHRSLQDVALPSELGSRNKRIEQRAHQLEDCKKGSPHCLHDPLNQRRLSGILPLASAPLQPLLQAPWPWPGLPTPRYCRLLLF